MPTKVKDIMLEGTGLYSLFKRVAAEAGLNLVSGSFEEGGTLSNINDVLLHIAEARYYSWGIGGTKEVPAGSTPETTGGIGAGAWVDASMRSLKSKLRAHLSQFGAYPDIATSANTDALEAAFNSGIPLYGTGKYIATRPIILTKKFDFDSMAGERGVRFYVNGNFEFFKIDEGAPPFRTSGSSLRGFEFGSEIDGSGYGVRSTVWAPIWTISDGIFQPTLRTGWDCPIILTRFDNVVFTDNGEYPCAIFDGSEVPLPSGIGGNRIQNANQFNWVRFRSRVNRLSNADHSIIFRSGMQNVWSNCEFAIPGGQVGTIEVSAVQLMRFLPGCWVEGPRSPYFIDCTTVGGFRPTQITFEGVHFAPKAGMNAWVGVVSEDTGDYDTAVSFVNCDEEATGVTSVQLTQNKQTLEYNTYRSLPSLDMNWFFYTKTPIGGLTPIPLTRGFYRDRLTTRGVDVRSQGRYPVISMRGPTDEHFLIAADTTTPNVTIRSETTTALNYQMDATAHFPNPDNTNSSGKPGKRWSVVYAGTGTISTSDETTKTFCDDELSDAVLDVWEGLEWRAFKFNDSIATKGLDKARIHFGLGAQTVKKAFEDAGLDPFKYALLCYDEWEETEDVIDEMGNVIVEGQPAGSRYGIRYEEALALEAAVLRRSISRLNQIMLDIKNIN